MRTLAYFVTLPRCCGWTSYDTFGFVRLGGRVKEQEEQERRADLISGLFAVLTAKLEDAATIAADCQAARPSCELVDGAGKLAELCREALILTSAVSAILELESSEA
jgi:hypothetical protein